MNERSLIIVKPDALQRNLLGEIIQRFERKGLKIVGLKMMQISDVKIKEHYAHHADKPFFAGLKQFMQASPVVMLVLEGYEAIEAIRLIVGPTKSRVADAGSIRGDLAMSVQYNIIHASDSVENGKAEIARFFDTDEVFEYRKIDDEWIYGSDER